MNSTIACEAKRLLCYGPRCSRLVEDPNPRKLRDSWILDTGLRTVLFSGRRILPRPGTFSTARILDRNVIVYPGRTGFRRRRRPVAPLMIDDNYCDDHTIFRQSKWNDIDSPPWSTTNRSVGREERATAARWRPVGRRGSLLSLVGNKRTRYFTLYCKRLLYSESV